MRVRLARVRPLTAAVLLAGLALGGLGCGGDDGPAEEERARLVDSLGFLGTDLGLSDDEVACTAEAIEERLEGDDLDAVAAEVRRVDAGDATLEDLPSEVSAPILESVTACAGAS